MSLPINMIYSESSVTSELAQVYHFQHIQGEDGSIINTVVTAWLTKSKTWLVAPVWCFQPIEKKSLNEGE